MVDDLSNIVDFDYVPLSLQLVQSIFYQMVSAVRYIHFKGFMHRNLTIESFLVNTVNECFILRLCHYEYTVRYRSRDRYGIRHKKY